MSGNGCSCAGSPAPEVASSSAATPCGGGAQFTEVVWETLALDASAVQVSGPMPTRGGNAFDFIILTIAGAGAIQTSFVAQVSNDGVNFAGIGAAGQSTAVGYSVMGPITGNGSKYIRLVAIEQLGNKTNFTVVMRVYCV